MCTGYDERLVVGRERRHLGVRPAEFSPGPRRRNVVVVIKRHPVSESVALMITAATQRTVMEYSTFI